MPPENREAFPRSTAMQEQQIQKNDSTIPYRMMLPPIRLQNRRAKYQKVHTGLDYNHGKGLWEDAELGVGQGGGGGGKKETTRKENEKLKKGLEINS